MNPEIEIPILRKIQENLSKIEDNPIRSLAGSSRSVAQAHELVEQAISFRQVIKELSEINDNNKHLEAIEPELLTGEGNSLQTLRDWTTAEQVFSDYANEFKKQNGNIPKDMPFDEVLKELTKILSEAHLLTNWTNWQEKRARAMSKARGLNPLVEYLEEGNVKIDKNEAVAIFLKAYAEWWLPHALDASEVLRRFIRDNHEDRIKIFKDLDDKARKLATNKVLRQIQHQLPSQDQVPRRSGLGTLRTQLIQKRPRMPVRRLLEALKEELPKLAPCLLMSPLSIAQYLPTHQATFDLVIFDEASQVTTWDAIGAIARGEQTIIVGDPKQLPPTNFFNRSDDMEDEDEFYESDMRSILDEARDAGIKEHDLKWHYRSHDEALIAFSNRNYYGGRLVTFPAPSSEFNAIQFHKISGIYLRGQGRVNHEEATKIVKFIKKKLTSWLDLPEKKRPTLGVITFNSQQQALILELLDSMRFTDDKFEWFFSNEREEPLIVKNIENIQGDERDFMLFSITFGPDAGGAISMNFGALNKEGGERRLNVAITRARQELHIFSSIEPEDIKINRAPRSIGVRDLRDFLDYAKFGPTHLPASREGSLGPAENPFEQAVADKFTAKGWEVDTQVGVSGFRIDLGIIHPDRAGVYLAGIECDGATYHSSATARDRDKIRQGILEDMGWRILRIWSPDWFRDADREVERLHKQLEKMLQEDRKAS